MIRIVWARTVRKYRNTIAAEQYMRLGADTTATLALDLLREWYDAWDCSQEPDAILRARTAMVIGRGSKPQPGRVVLGLLDIDG